ncbi:tyrosyl-DNA phosphodiesterase 1-like [Mercenaria mercenaria]|uniref:tyrosyl-DNA phosphodiesterase 1-like n=1 Tax=Mercenaria mercenaria TaxID=6596 RepID=UPI00234EFA4A|nr:tyrosyl-DNA phosphodiesterase 1-like [Mercenaria mercenaria]
MSDSDETVGPDSDETLPPEDEDDRCYSPDLFDDQVSKKSEMKPKFSTVPDKKSYSKTHDISDSESDSESRAREKNNRSNHNQFSKGGNSQKKINKESNGYNRTQSENTPEKVRTVEKVDNEAKSDRKKFMNEFLNMTDSESDSDYEQNKKRIQAMKDEQKNKSKVSKSSSDFGKESATDRQEKSKSAKDSDHVDKHHFSQKPHKKDYSKPFHKDQSSPQQSSDIKSFLKRKDSKEKSESSPSSLKRKHSRSPVPQELRKAVTEIMNENTCNSAKKKKVPCQYGLKCYRKNPSHFEEYSHPQDETYTPASKKAKLESSAASASKSKDKLQIPLSTKVRSESPSMSKVRSRSPTSSKVKSELPSTSKVKSRSPSASRGSSELPSTSKVKTHSPTSDCKVKKRSGSPCRNPKTVEGKLQLAQPYSLFLTKVAGIADKYNTTYAMDIKDILCEDMGNLTASCQFNYMFDIQWLMKQYPQKFRSKPLLIVHGEHGSSMAALQAQAMSYTNIRFCQAKLEMMYGTHHTKMMLLLYEDGLRVVIHTSNIIQQDWYQKTQGMWISPLFPRLPEAGKDKGDSPTHFKRDLIDYLQAYKAYQLKDWIDYISQHDMSTAKVVIIGSVPGRHIGDKAKSMWGHLKLRKVLQEHGPSQGTVKAWPVIGQFSSIGSMGPSKENWLCGEWQQSLSATKSGAGPQSNTRLQLIFPSRHNVRLSLEGYPAGGSIPYSANTAKKQQFLHDFFHVWKSEGRGRSRAMPHIKSYARPMQDGSKAAWFLVTSANLSKAAWGALEKKGAQLMIRSYEIGVLFLPKFFGEGEIFPITSDPESAATTNRFLLPYDLPPTIYDKKDRPWMWDIPYMDLPDTNGNVWCPFSK